MINHHRVLSFVLPILNIVVCFPLDQFFPYGSSAGDGQLAACDDCSTSSIPIAVNFSFFGSSFDSIYVNSNGDVTFGSPLTQYTSEPFPINGSHKIIAPFWTDIETSNGGQLWYRTTQNSELQQGTNKIRSLFSNIENFAATWMMIVTWDNVAEYNCGSTCSQRNTFQLALITDGSHSFAVFNYNKITWTKSSQVGFNAGDGIHYYSVPGSMTDAVLNLPQMSNIGIPGQYVFRVDQNKISNADTIDECASSPCVHGNCSNEYLYYECICEPGYTGVNCESEIDECQSSPCIHGNCSDHLSYYTCDCHAGYTGSHCQTDIDECTSSPCIHGTCTDIINGYLCSCMPGYTGVLCEIDVDECQSSPCTHGDCQDMVNSYSCHCYGGYTGQHCQIDINECLSSPCVQGNCTDQVNGFLCNCIKGYTGITCDTDINECESSPCIHGTCVNQIGNYHCICGTEYYGKQCSQFEVSLLTPLFVGLPLILLALLFLLCRKKCKRQEELDNSGEIFPFGNKTLGPSKPAFRNKQPSRNAFVSNVVNVIRSSTKFRLTAKPKVAYHSRCSTIKIPLCSRPYKPCQGQKPPSKAPYERTCGAKA
uniref:Sushi, nidogen and EGF-like domain-containing protein 1 n=1 Tax=Crassostrea virginica TaxID=6565 RepID=A0A8B8DPW6_CRAVI|nr:sushi, nidogen and EGF-like domain-containing protein 1 [Crassostrea virginica]